MLVVIIIIVLIVYILLFILVNKIVNRFLLEGQIIELIWTIIPIFFLLFLAVPSLKILYLTDEINNPTFTFKVIGHQWYWEYEYRLHILDCIYKDDYMIVTIGPRPDNTESMIEKELGIERFRLLDASETFQIPYKTQIRLIVTSDDVIHSFAVPALGIKIDAVPGRLNQVALNIDRPGLYYGQCSEICGVNHRFIPIVIESIRLEEWLNQNSWLVVTFFDQKEQI